MMTPKTSGSSMIAAVTGRATAAGAKAGLGSRGVPDPGLAAPK